MSSNNNHSRKAKRIIRFLEFFVVGVIFGISEDLVAIFFATGESITARIFFVAALVAIPFAVFSELIVDSARFRDRAHRIISFFIPDAIEDKFPK